MFDNQMVTEHRTLMERYQTSIETGSAAFPFAGMLGLRLVKVEPGYAEIELEAHDGHGNTLGTVHGGVYASVADTALGVAHGSLLGEGERSTTVDLQVKYLRPVVRGTIRAAARVLHSGKTLTYIECDMTDSQGRLVARANSTCMTLRESSA